MSNQLMSDSGHIGWLAPSNLTMDEWREFGYKLAQANGALNWMTGDWLLAADSKWGEMYNEAMEITGWSYDKLKQCKYVSGQFQLLTRVNNLSWSLHREIAVHSSSDKKLYYLEIAERDKLSVRKIIELIEADKKALPKAYIPKSHYTVQEWLTTTKEQKEIILSVQGDKTLNKQDTDNIEWARWSWNPITGCLHNCSYCYARDIATRFSGSESYPNGFEPSLVTERLIAPQNTKLPDLDKFTNPIDKIGWRNIFTCSMADLFGKWIPDEWIERVLEEIRNNPQWNFLLLTKFPIRMAEFEYPSNAWIGTTVDKQFAVDRAEKAFSKIRETGYNGIAWLSCEPMLERLTFTSLSMFNWVVVGGASSSTKTPEFRPPREWINHIELQAAQSNCKIYEKSNLLERIREYPFE